MRRYSSKELTARCTSLEVQCADIGSRINTGLKLSTRIAYKVFSDSVKLLKLVTQHKKLIKSIIETQNQNLDYRSLAFISKTESQLYSYLDSLKLAPGNNFHIQRYKVLFDLFDCLANLNSRTEMKLIYDTHIHNDFTIAECLKYIDKRHPNLHTLSTKIDNKNYTMQDVHNEMQGSDFTIRLITESLQFSKLTPRNQRNNYYESRFNIYEEIRLFENIFASTIQPNRITDCASYMQLCGIAIRLLKEAWVENKEAFKSHNYDILKELAYFENQIAEGSYHNLAKQVKNAGYKEPHIHNLALSFLIKENNSTLKTFSEYLANNASPAELMAKNYDSTKIPPLRLKGGPSIFQGNNVLHLAARSKTGGECILNALLHRNIRRSVILRAYFMKNEAGETAAAKFIENINDRKNVASYLKKIFRLITQGLGNINDRENTKLVLHTILQTDFLENNIHNIDLRDFIEIVKVFTGTHFFKNLHRLERSIRERVSTNSELELEQPNTKKQRHMTPHKKNSSKKTLTDESEDEEDLELNEIAKPPAHQSHHYGQQRLFTDQHESSDDSASKEDNSEEEPFLLPQIYSVAFSDNLQTKDFDYSSENLERLCNTF